MICSMPGRDIQRVENHKASADVHKCRESTTAGGGWRASERVLHAAWMFVIGAITTERALLLCRDNTQSQAA